jgi:hypothetical protein
MLSDDPTSVGFVIVTATTLGNMLRGIGFPKVSPEGSTVDGQFLRISLTVLRDQIDTFLKGQS